MLQLCVLVAAGVLFATSRLTTPTADQERALALLESIQVGGTSNAFADLWLLPWNIPERDRDALIAQDVARLVDHLATRGGTLERGIPNFQSVAEGRYPKVPDHSTDDPALCDLQGENCLQQVRRAPEAYARLLAGQDDLLQRHRQLEQHDHYRNLLPAHLLTPIPPLQRMSLPLTAATVDFVQGRTEQALSAICTSTTAWRRLGHHNDSLLISMIAAAIVQANARGFAQMLAELPLDHPLPGTCDTAFAPAQPEKLSLCPSMAGEFAIADAGLLDATNNALTQRFPLIANVISFLIYDHHRSMTLFARNYTWSCTDDTMERLRADLPVESPVNTTPGSLACFSNIGGCILAGVSAPAYTPYQHRVQDNAAQLRVVATLLTLRRDCGGRSARECLSGITTEPTTHRPVLVSEDGRSLAIAMYSDRWGPMWSIPLPPELAMP